MDEHENLGLGPEAAEIAALTARVAELERMMASMRSLVERDGATTAQPLRRPAYVAPQAIASAPPPPPMPHAEALPHIAAKDAMVDGVPLVSPLAFPPGLPKFSAPAAGEGKSLENRLGAQVFNLVGILALVISAAYGLKLAIEHGYLGPVARVLIGIAAGVAVVLWSEHFRRKGMKAFSYSLKAVGSAVLYLSLWAAFRLYHLLPPSVALGAMILVTIWNAFMAWSQDSEVLAAYALAGGFLTPLLLSTGGNHEGFLFIYLGAIDLVLMVLLRLKPWRALVPAAFVPTVIFFAGWYAKFFHQVATAETWDGQSTETALFALMFAAIFAVLPMGGACAEVVGDVIVPVLLPLSYGVFAGMSLASVMNDSGLHAGVAWLMVGLAAVFLGLMRLQKKAVSRAIHLAMAVVSLTVAIPLKASGHTLTTAWLVEGLVLLWASTKFSEEPEERQASRVLYGLSAAGYVLGLGSLVEHWFVGSVFGMEGFFNRDLGAAAVAIATLGGAVWLVLRERERKTELNGLAVSGLIAVNGVAALLCLRQLALTSGDYGRYVGFANASFATSLVGLGVFAAVGYMAWRLRDAGLVGMQMLVGINLVAIDGVGVLFCLRELFSTWSGDDLHAAFANASFATALVGLAVLAGVAYTAWKLKSLDAGRYRLLEQLTGATIIGFNLLAILTVEREIGALWHRGEEDLQRSLAISGFLMAYGAGLLAIGFVKRTAFIRWQALVLLLFTICKVFLYDISGLNALYRGVSFMGLGAVLMGISYAYQKDWLGLKEPGANEVGTGEGEAALAPPPSAEPPVAGPPVAGPPPPPAQGGVA